MGNAKIWWYPDPVGTLESLDLGQGLTEIAETTDQMIEQTESIDGAESRTTLRRRARVRITLSRFADGITRRKLEAFANHCERGGMFGFAEDSAMAFAAFIRPGFAPVRGDTTLIVDAQPWTYDGSYVTITAGDELVMYSQTPERMRENVVIVSHLGSGIVLSSNYPVLNTYSTSPQPIMVRHRGFWPLLRVPAGTTGILTDDHRLTYTLDFTAIEAVEYYAAFVGVSQGPKGTLPSSAPTTYQTISYFLGANMSAGLPANGPVGGIKGPGVLP